MLIVNTLPARRKYDKNIHSNIWGGENLAEASMCFSGSEAGQLRCEDTQWQQHEPQCPCHMWHSPGCADPSLLTTSQGAPAHTTAALTGVTAARLQLQHREVPGGRGNEVKSTEIPRKEAHFLHQCHWSLLHCSIISRSGLCRTHTGMSWPSRPVASSAICQLLRATLCGFYCSLALLLLMVPGQTSVQSNSQGHPVWSNCWFVFPVIQASPSQACPVSACLWLVPGPQALAVLLSGQVLSPPSTLRRGRFNGAHC